MAASLNSALKSWHAEPLVVVDFLELRLLQLRLFYVLIERNLAQPSRPRAVRNKDWKVYVDQRPILCSESWKR